MSFHDPAVRAYRSCGFHNHTLAELRHDPELRRGAILHETEAHIAHVPNVFGTFVDRGVSYHTALTLAGVDELPPVESGSKQSRGISYMDLKDIDNGKKLWQFRILIPKEYCCEELFSTDRNSSEYRKFCFDVCARTEIFAMEFLCCYRFFIEQVLATYERGNSNFFDPVRDNDAETHPKQEDVYSLICSFEAVAKKLKWFQDHYDKMEWSFTSIQQFLGKHIGKTRASMDPYYLKWLHECRVNPRIVEKKTMEYISMGFLDGSHDY